jgi:hypothetical protein
MQYIFTNQVFGQDGCFGVEFDSIPYNEKGLFEINSFFWTPTLVQELIDSIKVLNDEENLQHDVEGGHLTIITDDKEAHFFSHFSGGGTADFIWPTAQLLDFLEQFKRFIEENQ